MDSRNAQPTDDEKRSRILSAAFELCELRGVMAVRMDEVAARAQVSKGTLYRFFESKEALLLATIVDNYESGLRIAFERSDPQADAGQLLDQILDGLVRLLEVAAPAMRTFYQSWSIVAGDAAAGKRLDDFMKKFHTDRHRETAQLVRRGQQSGDFRTDVVPETIGQSIDALLNGYCYWATFDPEGATPGALRAAFDTLIRDRLLAQPRDSAESGEHSA